MALAGKERGEGKAKDLIIVTFHIGPCGTGLNCILAFLGAGIEELYITEYFQPCSHGFA